MRILHVQPYFQPKIGYQETYLTRKQTQAGHEVLMVTSDRYFPYPNYEQSVKPVLGSRVVGAGCKTEEGIATSRLPVHFEVLSAGVLMMKGLAEACQNFQPDVVQCHGTFTFTARQMALVKERLGAPMLFDNHASDFNTDFTRSFSRRAYRLMMRRLIIPQVMRAADALVAIGEGEVALLAREYEIDPDQIHLLYLGADTDVFCFDQPARDQTRKDLGFSQDDILIVHAGKLEPQKDVHVMLDAIFLLMEKEQKLHLLLVGGGEDDYLDRLKQQIKAASQENRVKLIGMVPTEKLRDFYSAGDIGVWPGNYSNTIVEAMACRLPIVVPEVISELSSNKHLLQGDAAIGYQRGEVEDLREKISALITDLDLRNQTGQKARRLIETKLSWDVINAQFVALYESLISQKQAGD